MITKIRKELDEQEKIRSEAIKAGREIIPLCARAIRSVQKGDYKPAEKAVSEIEGKIKKIEVILADYPVVKDATLGAIYQEYAELCIVLAYLEKKKLVEVNVPPEYYLLGLGDAIGELKRVGMELLAAGKKKEAKTLYEALEDIYADYAGLTYPNSIVPGLKRKQDVARGVLNNFHDQLVRK